MKSLRYEIDKAWWLIRHDFSCKEQAMLVFFLRKLRITKEINGDGTLVYETSDSHT